MYLGKRIESLEKKISPKMDYWISYTVGDKTEDEAVEEYCARHKFDVELLAKCGDTPVEEPVAPESSGNYFEICKCILATYM